MPTLYEMRHSAAHVLAQAILQRFPTANLGIGPVIDDGFYYDFDLPESISDDDLVDLEARMNAIIKEGQTFKHYDLSRAEATDYLKKRNQGFKIELIEDLNLPEYSFYENGPFVDLCRGPHVENTSQIGCVKLLRISGAYWRGSEKNKMLTRIYGLAFLTKEELQNYVKMQEEAEKRDHRILGEKLDLFTFSDMILGERYSVFSLILSSNNARILILIFSISEIETGFFRSSIASFK
jgi:threonyl-tRNA synthetase